MDSTSDNLDWKDPEEALLNGSATGLIQGIVDLEDSEDFRSLIDLALDLQDMDALWYIVEVGGRFDEELDAYLLRACGSRGQSLSCTFYQDRANPFSVLARGVANANPDLVLYAVDLLYAPLEATNFATYSTEEYSRALEYSQEVNRGVEEIILDSSPSFFERIFRDLPPRLVTRLTLFSRSQVDGKEIHEGEFTSVV